MSEHWNLVSDIQCRQTCYQSSLIDGSNLPHAFTAQHATSSCHGEVHYGVNVRANTSLIHVTISKLQNQSLGIDTHILRQRDIQGNKAAILRALENLTVWDIIWFTEKSGFLQNILNFAVFTS